MGTAAIFRPSTESNAHSSPPLELSRSSGAEDARRAAREMEAARPDTYTTDCSLSGLQIQDVRGEKPRHPISIVREAYGMPEER